MTKDKSVWVGGIVILMQEPSDGHIPTQYIPYADAVSFQNSLSRIKGARLKSLDGPYINGIWAATFSEIEIPYEEVVSQCGSIFNKYLQDNILKETKDDL